MKIMIKSLAGGNFHLEAEPTDTIATIKSKIKDAQGHAPEQQKIIFSGKILTDDKTVQDCNIKEKDFLVVMVSKPKAPKAAPAAAAASTSAEPAKAEAAPAAADPVAEASAPTPMAEDKPAAAATESSTPATAFTESAAPADSASASGPAGMSGSFISGSELESAMQNMVEMGFEREQVQKAMRAAFNNPERAVEYLMTGIPASSEPQQPPPAAAAPTQGESTPARPAAAAPSTPSNPRSGNLFEAAAAQAQGGGRGAAGGGGAGGAGGAGGLGDLPGADNGQGEQVIDLGNPAMLAQLQQLVQQNPAALQPLIQAIAQSNPQLAEALNADPQGVLSLLAGGAGAGGDEMDLPSMAELSEEDRTAVQQIVAMGIPESKAIESYFMCGKNVEMAVQYYFENPQDFDD